MPSTNHYQKLLKHEAPAATMHAPMDNIVLAKGEGSILFDSEGRSYIDACAGFGSLALGHNHETAQQIYRDSGALLAQGMGDVYASENKIEFLETLTNAVPSPLEMGMLALSGGQAVEIALKTASLATGRFNIISFQGAYHGLDIGSLAVTHRREFRDPFDPWLPKDKVSFLPFGCEAEQLTQTLCKLRDSTGLPCAIIVEPIQGRSGVIQPPPGWLKDLRRIATDFGVLLIFDEIFTGLGRTGCRFISDNVVPDLLCVGKAIGGGMPLSACVGSKDLMTNAWPDTGKECIHTGTFFGHPLSCKLGTKTIQTVLGQNLPDRAAQLGAEMMTRLKSSLSDKHPKIAIRGSGLMIAIDLGQPGHGVFLMNQLKKLGVIAIPAGNFGEVLSLSPALNIPADLSAQLGDKIVEAIDILNLK